MYSLVYALVCSVNIIVVFKLTLELNIFWVWFSSRWPHWIIKTINGTFYWFVDNSDWTVTMVESMRINSTQISVLLDWVIASTFARYERFSHICNHFPKQKNRIRIQSNDIKLDHPIQSSILTISLLYFSFDYRFHKPCKNNQTHLSFYYAIDPIWHNEWP